MRTLVLALLLAGLGITTNGCFLQDEIFGKDRSVVSGRVSFGFEVASFQPCDSDEQWWITGSNELYEAWTALDLAWYESGFAIVRGRRSEKGEYGHLGAYQREFEVKDVIEVRPLEEGECTRPEEN